MQVQTVISDGLRTMQTTNVMTLLANPYPIGEEVVVINQTAQLVDETLRPVPLSEVTSHPASFLCNHLIQISSMCSEIIHIAVLGQAIQVLHYSVQPICSCSCINKHVCCAPCKKEQQRLCAG